MHIHLRYTHPTPSHCDVAIFVNHALAGTIRLRQDEIVAFQQIMAHGCSMVMDSFDCDGNPDPEAVTPPRGCVHTFGDRACLTCGWRPPSVDTFLAELKRYNAPVTLVLAPIAALTLAGLIQLAMRHPQAGSNDFQRRTATLFLDDVRAHFADAPAILDVLRGGDDLAE